MVVEIVICYLEYARYISSISSDDISLCYCPHMEQFAEISTTYIKCITQLIINACYVGVPLNFMDICLVLFHKELNFAKLIMWICVCNIDCTILLI